jgi:lipid A 3-O-deacylase
MRRSGCWLKIAGGLGLGGWMLGTLVASEVPAPKPLRYDWEISSGVLWKVGGGATPLTYVVTPLIISLRIPPITERPWAGGTLVFRSRFSLLLEPIIRGPEHSFVGVAAAGELEWRTASGRFAGFFASGGGFGWMDSKGHEIAGAQGQDFNLNWLAHGGLRFRPRPGWQYSAGVYFQHISNRGMDRVNPGLNAVGPMVAISQRF